MQARLQTMHKTDRVVARGYYGGPSRDVTWLFVLQLNNADYLHSQQPRLLSGAPYRYDCPPPNASKPDVLYRLLAEATAAYIEGPGLVLRRGKKRYGRNVIFALRLIACLFIHSFSSLSYDRSKASSKASSPHSAIQSFLLQMRVSSPSLKVIQ